MQNTKNLFSTIACLIMLSFHASPVLSGENVWTTSGPEGASVKTIAINPMDNNVIYIGTIQNGVYKSIDGGAQWIHLEISTNLQSTTMREIVIHPFGPDTVYAASAGGIFKSTDAGLSWNNISPAGRENQEYRAVVLDPLRPYIIITGGVWDRWKSTDSGQNWTEFSIEPEGGLDHEIDGLAINPLNPNVMFLVTADSQFGRGIYKSTDEGNTWFSTQNNCDSSGVGCDVEIDPVDTSIIYFARDDGFRESGGRFLSKTTDNGSTWFDISPVGFSEWSVLDICISHIDHNTLFIGTKSDGIFKSTNGGNSWFPQNDSLRALSVFSIEIAPLTGVIFSGFIMDGIYKSTNGGGYWRRISQNICAADIMDIAFIPNSNSVFAVGQIGCYYLPSEGESWSSINTGIPLGNKPGSIEIDVHNPSDIIINTFSPIFPPPSPNGVYLSADLGLTWRFSNNGLPENQGYFDLGISYLDNSRRIYTGTFYEFETAGVYYSDDIGETWTKCQGGLPNLSLYPIIVAPNNSNIVLTADGDNRVYLSTDRGDTWQETTPLPRIDYEFVFDINIDPTDYNHIFASCHYGGLFESTDLGQSWNNINNDLPLYPSIPKIYGPAINPSNTQNMFVFSNHNGVFQTHDGGTHWESFNNGLDISASSGKIYLAPNDTTRLYVITPSRSVWSIHRTLDGVNDDNLTLPYSLTLSSYPNPFNAQTTISYSLSAPGPVTLTIYNLLGQKVATLVDGEQTAGEHTRVWDAQNQPSGVYFCRLHAENFSKSSQMVLLR